MRKISFFLPTLNFGGIEANTIRLAESFLMSGYKVDLIVGTSNGEYRKRIKNNINLITLNKKGLISMLFPLISYVKEKKPDVIITGGEGANILLAIVKRFLPKTKVIISIRSNLTIEYKEMTNSKRKIIFPILAKFLYKNADNIVAVSKGVAQDASEFLGYPLERFQVIYNPIVNEQLFELMEQKIEHRWLNDEKFKVVLFVGRLTKQKDLPLLIKGFLEARKSIDNLKLIIIGDGPDKKTIQDKLIEKDIQTEVDMIGFVQNPYPYMKKSNVFVLTSKWEGFGNVLVEALSTGVPIVSTDCPNGPSEILAEGKYGHLIDVGNSSKLAQAIINVVNSDDDHVDKRKLRATEFSVDAAREKYTKIIDEIL